MTYPCLTTGSISLSSTAITRRSQTRRAVQSIGPSDAIGQEPQSTRHGSCPDCAFRGRATPGVGRRGGFCSSRMRAGASACIVRLQPVSLLPAVMNGRSPQGRNRGPIAWLYEACHASAVKPLTSRKCASFVTKVKPCWSATAATQISFSGIGCPSLRRAAFTSPYRCAV